MANYITHIATVEIPVTNIEKSVEFYEQIVGLHVLFKEDQRAMLSFQTKGAPTIFLVQTTDTHRLTFSNTFHDVEHSVIDFYTSELKEFYHWLLEQKVAVGKINIDEKSGLGGFGFKDPDGNMLSACNILHPNQK